jgi:predicted nucleic acid-binding protein
MVAIFYVERIAPFVDQVRQRVNAQGVVQVTSELTRLECRVKPVRERNNALLSAFDDYFAMVIDEIVPLSRQVVDRATDLRAHYRFHTPDSLHLAAAVESSCDLFLTHDRRLLRFREIRVESLT